MKVYRLDCDHATYQGLTNLGEFPSILLEVGHGRSLLQGWVPLPAGVFRGDAESRGRKAGDNPWLSGSPAFSGRAAKALWDLLAPHGEFLPLSCDEGDYCVYNVLTTLTDAVDLAASDVERYAVAFRLPQIGSDLFVTEAVAERIVRCGLEGFELRLRWEGPEASGEPTVAKKPIQERLPEPGPPPNHPGRLGVRHPDPAPGLGLGDLVRLVKSTGLGRVGPNLWKRFLGRVRPALMEYVLPAVRLHTTPVPSGTVPCGRSKVGGLPDLPAGVEWPRVEGRTLWLIAQINLAEAADARLPAAGMLYFFCDAVQMDGWAVHYAGPDQTPARTALPPVLHPEMQLGECSVTFGRVLTLPSHDSPLVEALGLTEEESEVYSDLWDSLTDSYGGWPLHQMLGHAATIQGDMIGSLPADPSGWTLLFQFDSDDAAEIMWGDGGTLYYWIRNADLAAGRFDRVHFEWQCG